MTQDEIIRMAREAGFEVVDGELRLYFDGSKALLKPNYMGTVVDGLKEFAALVAAHEREKQAEQEPVRIENIYKRGDKYFAWIGDDYVQIYTAPVQQVELTDEELLFELKAFDASAVRLPIGFKLFARAVIAADREKNK